MERSSIKEPTEDSSQDFSDSSDSLSVSVTDTESATAKEQRTEMRQHIVTVDIKSYSSRSERWRRRRSTQIENADPTFFPSFVNIVTWNIDFMEPNTAARLYTILDHLRNDCFGGAKGGDEPGPYCILLQEVASEAFPALLTHPWVRRWFQVVPTSTETWPGGRYGVVTLVSRTLVVAKALSLEYSCSFMGRTALMVDIRVRIPDENLIAGDIGGSDTEESAGTDEGPQNPSPQALTLRIANTHLESLPVGAGARPIQLKAVAAMLRDEGIHGGVVCGDMNAIGPSDAGIHTRAGLRDAWTRGDADASGFTWGYQPTCKFPVGRLDKVFYAPTEDMEVDEPQRVGIGLKTAQGQWASDHYGLMTTVWVARGQSRKSIARRPHCDTRED